MARTTTTKATKATTTKATTTAPVAAAPVAAPAPKGGGYWANASALGARLAAAAATSTPHPVAAPLPVAAPQAAPVQHARAQAQPAAPNAPAAPLYVLGHWPVRAMAGSTWRAYAYHTAKALQAAQPKGFTLAQYRAALAQGAAAAAAAGYAMPQGAQGAAATAAAQRHNMPTWAAAQAWLLPA